MVTIYTHEPITWTNDTVNNLNTFNQEIKEKMTDIDNSKDAVLTLTNKTLTSPVINTPTGIVKADVGLSAVDNTSDTTKNAAAVTLTNKILTDPVMNGLVKIAVLRQNIATDTYINNTVILTGWKFANVPNILNFQAIGVTFGITFSEIPIVTVTPISKRVGSDPTTLTELCETNHMALETVKVGDISTTGFTGELWSSVAYDAGDRVGFMWTAIGQLN